MGPYILFISNLFMFTNIWYLLVFCLFCIFCVVFSIGRMAPQVIINFNGLPVTFVVKLGMFQARKNVQVVFAVGPRSTLAKFPLSN